MASVQTATTPSDVGQYSPTAQVLEFDDCPA
jgi:hypothetical protein